MTPTFTIVTPSFRQLDWLKLCAASIADQQGVSLEHFVQDAGSGPELEAWAARWETERPPGTFRLITEKDAGMYDAVNRGLKRATGEIVAYLNCDEQYLPGTLSDVEEFFSTHPQVDVLFGDAIVVDAAGEYLCSRPVVLPTFYHTQICTLGVFTAATFFRRSLLEKQQLYFDAAWRDTGDAIWVTELLRRKIRLAVRRQFLSSFTDTGENMNTKPNARAEQQRMRESAPVWAQKLAPLWVLHYRLRRLLAGIYWPRPLDYAIYTTESRDVRRTFHVERPTFIWQRPFRHPVAA